jgi:hypothetical protein
MNRSQYGYELDQWDLIRWRGAVMSAIRGKRGQSFLRDAVSALEAMPDKRLIAEALVDPDGEYCLMGAVAAHRGVDVSEIDPEEPEHVAATMGIAAAMAQEIAHENDYRHYTPEQRYEHMLAWVKAHLKGKK